MVAVPESVVRRRLTLADYEALPDDADYEIIDGVLYVAPRPRPRHQAVAGQLVHILIAHVEATGQGKVIPDADLIIDERNAYVSPDIMYFAGDRLARIDPNEMIRILPDLIVEVLSPATDRRDLLVKRSLYEPLGVPHYWIVDAERSTIRECVLGPGGVYAERAVSIDQPFEPARFPGLQIDLRRVFA